MRQTSHKLFVTLSAALLVATPLIMTASPAQAFEQKRDATGTSSSGSVVQGGDGSVTMTVEAASVSAAPDGSTGSGGGATAWSQSVTASVHPVCWYAQSSTGAEKAKYIDEPVKVSV